ncbi:hypothetical protein OAO87_02480 [bacterium]|nr:hypothetical protein [bacterium]
MAVASAVARGFTHRRPQTIYISHTVLPQVPIYNIYMKLLLVERSSTTRLLLVERSSTRLLLVERSTHGERRANAQSRADGASRDRERRVAAAAGRGAE